jgi:hypothetical protein
MAIFFIEILLVVPRIRPNPWKPRLQDTYKGEAAPTELRYLLATTTCL